MLLKIYNVNRVAEFYRTSRATVYRWINSLGIDDVKKGHKLDKEIVNVNEYVKMRKLGYSFEDLAEEFDLPVSTIILYDRRCPYV